MGISRTLIARIRPFLGAGDTGLGLHGAVGGGPRAGCVRGVEETLAVYSTWALA